MDKDRFDSDDALGTLSVSLEPLKHSAMLERRTRAPPPKPEHTPPLPPSEHPPPSERPSPRGGAGIVLNPGYVVWPFRAMVYVFPQ